jgi:hypothetical protein
VKELLNSFVLSYRLVLRRTREGLLSGSSSARALELAKLVCLRLEFPLFAGDLAMDARLPDLVLQRYEDQSVPRPPGVTDDVWERAGQYAAGVLPVDTSLARSSDQEEVAADDQAAPQETASDEGATDEVSEPDATATTMVVNAVHRTQHLHLIRYLSKTRHVPGPRRDLIYLESFGAAYGLEPEFAEQLEDYAVDGREDDVVRMIDDLNADGQRDALRMLAQRIRESPPGVEGQNAVSTLLGVLGTHLEREVSDLADELAEAVASQQGSYTLRDGDLPGAFLLGLRTSREAGRALLGQVLERDEILDDSDLSLFAIRTAGGTFDQHRARLGEILADRLFVVENAEALSGALLVS